MKVSVSISDVPVLRKLDYLFIGLKEAGADGIEIVTGVKSRWSWNRIKELSEEYELPITSVHQPPWSAINLYFDDRFVQHAVDIGVKNFVYHPLPRSSFSDIRAREYVKRLSILAKYYNVNIMLENMPSVVRQAFARQIYRLTPDTMQVENFIPLLEEFDLNFNLDTSHAFVAEPQKEDWFNKIFPRMKNIHLSSFKKGRDHLPLYMGDFNTKTFVQTLKKKKYTGLITLEVFYPRMMRMSSFDFEAIKGSIDAVKSV